MNAPTLSRICAHSGSSFGSNTTHCVPRYRLSSMNSASRRTGTYLYSSASWSAPRSVRAPQTTRPMTGKMRRQLMPSGLSMPFSASVRFTSRLWTPLERGVEPGRRLPDAALRVGARHDAGDRCRTARRCRVWSVAQRVGLAHAREVERGVARLRRR